MWHVVQAKRVNIARFERVLRQTLRQDFVERGVNRCRNPLQHHQWIIATSFLRRHRIKFLTVVQQAGDIVVILPKVGLRVLGKALNLSETSGGEGGANQVRNFVGRGTNI